jgi:bifunctional non-homologous end joining protein LigD
VPLEEYRRKRDFAATPEPAGGETAGGAEARQLRFVVHKHAARALHYDVRLEIGGAYASWAVPKGPSLDPAERRLAVHVEDHPIEYGSFEGTIPAGEYGGGTVMVWDRGNFAPIGDPVAAVAAGQLKLVLDGAKLRGGFALVRMKPRPGETRENWLLIKERDAQARARADYDVLAELPDSADSGRTMEQIAASGTAWTNGGVGGTPPAQAAGPAGADGPAVTAPAPDVRPRAGSPADAVAGPMPIDAEFQLAMLVGEAPEGDEWIHEVKYDGYRLRLALERGRARVTTRNGADWTERFAPLAAAAEALPASSALIDGEAVVFDPAGRPDFGLLQEALSSAGRAADIDFAAFDLLYLDGFDLRGEPLLRRKESLRALLEAGAQDGPMRYVEHFAGRGPEFHASSCELLLEGSVSKRGDRPWVPGRSHDWLKTKCLARQEFVVGGWTDPAGSRDAFGALLLGVHDAGGTLRYAGRVGTGFTERALASLRERLDALAADEPPFAAPPRLKGAHWVRPELVAEVEFREWTRDGVVRQPSFEGLREDADPRSVTRETPAEPTDPPAPAHGLAVAGISNPDKILEPAGISKGDLARYYAAIAPAMLPHLAGRLLTIVRCPHGAGGGSSCFYQKHPEERGWPQALRVIDVEEKGGPQPYFCVDDEAGLLSLVQLGSLELHTWNSLARDPEHPDRVVFDLDPGVGVGFADVVSAARTVRDALGAIGLGAFPKTTGGHGLHVVTPIEACYGFDTVRDAAHALVDRLAAADPTTFTAKMAKAARPGRVFVDYLRNAHGATAVCAFSTRARPGAPVSVPVAWDELDGLDPASLDANSVPRRVAAQASDPWAGYEAARRPITPAMLTALGVASP